jgi:DNA invertase Pin-like site-specific DNA recombinase
MDEPTGKTDRRRKLTPEQRARIFELRAQGWTYRAIGVELGITTTHVGRVLRQGESKP